jgi:hypothetical protein
MAGVTRITEIDRHRIGNVLVAIDRLTCDGIVTFEVTISVNGLIKRSDVYITKADAIHGACDMVFEIMEQEPDAD